MKPTTALRDQVLALSPVERAELIEDLLASFDEPSRASIDAAWGAVAEERIDAYDRGETKSISLEEAQRRLRAK